MSSADLTAKVLATENIHIVRKNVKTAAFDLMKRTLILPTWKDMTPEAESMLVCHEVSHALFTPKQYVDEVKANRAIRSYLNVLEDVRCEKLFQEHYQGSRKTFIAGYKALNERDFFGLSRMSVNDLNLIDRINVFFKCGHTSGVKFLRQEQKFVEKIGKMVTFQDVLDLANEIYASEKERVEKQKEEEQNNEELQEELQSQTDEFDDDDFGDDDFGDDDEESDEEFGDDDFETDDDAETKETEESDEDTEEEESDSGTASDSDDEDADDASNTDEEENDGLDSTTQNEFEQNVESTTDEMFNPEYVQLKPLDFEYIITHKQVAEHLSARGPRINVEATEFFKKNSNKQVAHIAQQFELKKAADIYRRQRVTKSGNLDVNKVATYKVNSDIFRRNVKLPNGQNHGMVMLLDWSGSMRSDKKFEHSLRQSIQLAIFCKKVNIPFRIYAFATHQRWFAEELNNQGFSLLELLTNEMSTKEFNQMIGWLISDYITYALPLGSTPLAPALMTMLDIIPQFKAEYRLDKVSLISFTDGENTTGIVDSGYTTFDRDNASTNQNIFISDHKSKKNYQVKDTKNRWAYRTDECTALYQILKDRYNINIISFMVAPVRDLAEAYTALGIRQTYWNNQYGIRGEFMKNRFLEVHTAGRDAAYIVEPKMLEMEEMTTSGISGSMSAAQIARSLVKTSKKSLKAKVLLEKFIEIIA